MILEATPALNEADGSANACGPKNKVSVTTVQTRMCFPRLAMPLVRVAIGGQKTEACLTSPLPRTRGRGVGGEGVERRCQKPPHPGPLSPSKGERENERYRAFSF